MAETMNLQVQRISHVCITRRKRGMKIGALFLLIIAVGIAAAVGAYRYFQPMALTHPDFEKNAVSGQPDVDESRYGYSTLEVNTEYSIMLCGIPSNDGQNVYFYLTNPAENGVWFRAEILDEAGEILGSTGVLKQGEYMPCITLNHPLSERETVVTVHVIAYEPDTWQSAGNVNLNLTVYLDYE